MKVVNYIHLQIILKTITHPFNPLLEITKGTEGFSEENDEFLSKFTVTFPLKNTLFFIFITSMHSETSETTDIFCIYNLFDYIKTFTELTKKLLIIILYLKNCWFKYSLVKYV